MCPDLRATLDRALAATEERIDGLERRRSTLAGFLAKA